MKKSVMVIFAMLTLISLISLPAFAQTNETNETDDNQEMTDEEAWSFFQNNICFFFVAGTLGIVYLALRLIIVILIVVFEVTTPDPSRGPGRRLFSAIVWVIPALFFPIITFLLWYLYNRDRFGPTMGAKKRNTRRRKK